MGSAFMLLKTNLPLLLAMLLTAAVLSYLVSALREDGKKRSMR